MTECQAENKKKTKEMQFFFTGWQSLVRAYTCVRVRVRMAFRTQFNSPYLTYPKLTPYDIHTILCTFSSFVRHYVMCARLQIANAICINQKKKITNERFINQIFKNLAKKLFKKNNKVLEYLND